MSGAFGFLTVAFGILALFAWVAVTVDWDNYEPVGNKVRIAWLLTILFLICGFFAAAL